MWAPSDDADDWDFDMCPKPSEVQNDMYVRDEDEEDEVEDLDGRKVMVRRRLRPGTKKTKREEIVTFLLDWTGVFHQEWKGGGP